MSIQTILILLGIGLVAGFLSSMVGIGGGIIIVPALAYFLSMDQKTAQGTSIFILLLPIGALGALEYYKRGHVEWRAGLVIAATFVIGSFLGAKMVNRIDGLTVKRIFAVFMIVIAFKFLFLDNRKPAPTGASPDQSQTKP